MKGYEKLQQRVPLGQLAQMSGQNQVKAYEKPERDVQIKSKQSILNASDSLRLKQLRSKYSKGPLIVNSTNKQNSKSNSFIDNSFNNIQIWRTKQKGQTYNQKSNYAELFQANKNSDVKSSASRSYSSSLHVDNFDRKIQKTESNIERNLEKIQQKMMQLSKINDQQYKQKVVQAFFRPSISKNQVLWQQNYKKRPLYSGQDNIHIKNIENQVQEVKQPQNQQADKQLNCGKQQYARHLQKINFVEQMKKKIQQIQLQKRSNLSKKTSCISDVSTLKPFSQENKQKVQISDKFEPYSQAQKLTLANLAPNLAESQIFQISQKGRFTDSIYENKNRQKKSFVIKQFQFKTNDFPGQSTQNHYFSKNPLKQVKQHQNQSLMASPCLRKCDFEQKNQINSNYQQESRLVEDKALQGDFDLVEQKIQKQFVTLINRIAHQAQIDNKFATKIHSYDNICTAKGSLKTVLVQKIRQQLRLMKQILHQSTFEVNQMQLDPLLSVQRQNKQFSQAQISKLSMNLGKQYQKISSYYETKLSSSYNQKTVTFFIQELQKCHALRPNEDLNIGHLTSYINMRTGKNLRNRFFYKLLKRIGKHNNKTSSTLKRQDLLKSLTKRY